MIWSRDRMDLNFPDKEEFEHEYARIQALAEASKDVEGRNMQIFASEDATRLLEDIYAIIESAANHWWKYEGMHLPLYAKNDIIQELFYELWSREKRDNGKEFRPLEMRKEGREPMSFKNWLMDRRAMGAGVIKKLKRASFKDNYVDLESIPEVIAPESIFSRTESVALIKELKEILKNSVETCVKEEPKKHEELPKITIEHVKEYLFYTYLYKSKPRDTVDLWPEFKILDDRRKKLLIEKLRDQSRRWSGCVDEFLHVAGYSQI